MTVMGFPLQSVINTATTLVFYVEFHPLCWERVVRHVSARQIIEISEDESKLHRMKEIVHSAGKALTSDWFLDSFIMVVYENSYSEFGVESTTTIFFFS